jgi:CRISPR type IV-associated protein Csf3
MDRPSMPIHLDSLVAYARYQRALKEMESGEIRDIIQDLPLLKDVRDGFWVWQASALAFENVSNAGMRHWTRKTVIPEYYALELKDGLIERGRKLSGSADEARQKNLKVLCDKYSGIKPFAQRIDTVRGYMKSELQSYPVFVANKAVAYCMGDAEALESLLDPNLGLLTNIGKRSRLDHGRIVGLSVTRNDAALELWKQRILPWQEDGYLGIEANVIPPYWDATGRHSAWAHPSIF